MKTILKFIREEPAMIAAVIVSILAVFLNWNDAQQGQYKELIAQVLVILAGGGSVRQLVTPVAKQ